MKHIFVVNNISKNNRLNDVLDRIEEVCKNEQIDYEVRHSTKEANIDVQLADQKDKENIIFGVGGDGTVNLILNEIVGTKNILGILPVGSGNDFYKALSKYEELYIDSDIGKINDKYFMNTACFGIDAEVAANTEVTKKWKIPTSQIYNASILYTFSRYKNKELRFYNSNINKEGKFATIAICNGEYYGGGYHIAPKSKINDGLFDIYYAGDLKKMKLPSLIMKLKNGNHEETGFVTRFQDNKITIESPNIIACNIDGETLKSDKFEIELIKGGIKIYNNKELVNSFLNTNSDNANQAKKKSSEDVLDIIDIKIKK